MGYLKVGLFLDWKVQVIFFISSQTLVKLPYCLTIDLLTLDLYYLPLCSLDSIFCHKTEFLVIFSWQDPLQEPDRPSYLSTLLAKVQNYPVCSARLAIWKVWHTCEKVYQFLKSKAVLIYGMGQKKGFVCLFILAASMKLLHKVRPILVESSLQRLTGVEYQVLRGPRISVHKSRKDLFCCLREKGERWKNRTWRHKIVECCKWHRLLPHNIKIFNKFQNF